MDRPRRSSSSLPKTANSITASSVISSNGIVQERQSTSHPSSPTRATSKRRKSGSPLILLKSQTSPSLALKSSSSAASLTLDPALAVVAVTASGPATVANSAETGQAATTPNDENSLITAHRSGQSNHPSPPISASASLSLTSASRAEAEHPDADGGDASKAIPQPSSLGAASLKEMSRPSSSHAMAATTTTTTTTAPGAGAATAPSAAAAVGGKSSNTPVVNQTMHQDGDDSAVAAGAARKGGHSLRKRARVDYTFEHIEDAPTVPNSSSAPSASHRSSKKRRVHADDFNDYHHSAKRRISSAGVESSPTSSRRRNPSRKTSEAQLYSEPIEEDQIPVMDTIEVGGVAYNEEPHVDEAEYQEYEPQPMDHDHTIEQPVSGDPSVPDYSQYYGQAPAGQMPWNQDEAAAESYQIPIGSLEPEKAAVYPEDPETQLQEEAYEAQNPQTAIEASPQPIDPMLTAEYSSQTEIRSSPLKDEASLDAETALSSYAVEPAQGIDPALQSASIDQPTRGDGAGPSAAPVAEDAVIEARGSGDEVNHDHLESPLKPSIQIQDADSTAVVESEHTEENGDLVEKESPAAQNESTPDTSLSQTAESQIAKATIEAEESFDLDQGQEQQQDAAFLEDGTDTLDLDRREYPDYPYVRKLAKVFPAPTGRWAHLTPYVQDQFISLPEREDMIESNDTSDQPSDEKYSDDKDGIDAEPLVEDNDDAAQAPTPLPATPRAGSLVQDSNEATNLNSPAPGVDDKDDGAGSESQEDTESDNDWKFRKVRDAQDFYDAFENWEQLSREELIELCDSAAVSMRAWREEYECLRSIVEDEENAQKRRAYEAKPAGKPFAIKGHHADLREPYTELRYLQDQDKRMAAAYAFEHDPHVTKVGKQDPLTQRAGIATRGRALRSQPKQTAKATETEEVTGKRQRKPVQLFDGSQDVSRATTPVPGRSRRRRTQNAESEASVPPASANVGNEDNSGAETGPGKRRRRAPRSQVVATAVEDGTPPSTAESLAVPDMQPTKPRRNRKSTVRADEDEEPPAEQAATPEPNPVKRRMLTLKVPKALSKARLFAEPASAVTDPHEDRPSTSSSEASGNTAGSAYIFRPKRQKRFRDEPEDDSEMLPQQQPPRKRVRKSQGSTSAGNQKITPSVEAASMQALSQDSAKPERRTTKIKVIRNTHAPSAAAASESRTGTPLSLPNSTEDGDEKKEYSAMTKSEKMSASMKSRWANGNMAGAVEKRKATLAAKKAAQVAAEQKVGPLAPKPKKAGKKDTPSQGKSTPQSTPSATPQPTPQQNPHSTMKNYVNPAPPEIPPQYQHPGPQQPMSFHHQPILHQHGHPMPAHGHPGFMQNQPPPPPHGHQQPQPSQQSRASSFMHGLPGMGLFYPTK